MLPAPEVLTNANSCWVVRELALAQGRDKADVEALKIPFFHPQGRSASVYPSSSTGSASFFILYYYYYYCGVCCYFGVMMGDTRGEKEIGLLTILVLPQ